MPTNLYGPGDNFDLQSGHVLPALIRKAHAARASGAAAMEIWGRHGKHVCIIEPYAQFGGQAQRGAARRL